MILPDAYAKFSDFIASLLVDFNTLDAIPYPVSELDWRKIGNTIARNATFVRLGAPTTEGFPNWREWGKMVYYTAAR